MLTILLVPTGQPGEKRVLSPLLKSTPFVPLVQPFAGDSWLTCVRVDDTYGSWLGTRHLISLGHRRIGLLGGMGDTGACVRRRAGWQKALTDQGLSAPSRLVAGSDFSRESGYDAAQRLLRLAWGPTALIGVSSYKRAWRHRGHSRDGNASGRGYRRGRLRRHLLSHYSPRAPHPVSQPKEELGEAAARALVDRIAGRNPKLPCLLPDLVVRRSCGAWRVRQEDGGRK